MGDRQVRILDEADLLYVEETYFIDKPTQDTVYEAAIRTTETTPGIEFSESWNI